MMKYGQLDTLQDTATQQFGAAAHRTDIARLELSEFPAILRRRIGWIIAVSVVAVALAAAYSLLTDKYTSTAEILLDPQGLQILNNDLYEKARESQTGLVEVETQQHVMSSRSVLEEVVDREKLATHPLFGNRQPGLMSRLKQLLPLEEKPGSPREKAIARLEYDLNVSRADNAYVVSLSVTTADADVSAELANAIADVYLENRQSVRAKAAGRASDVLSKRADSLEGQVREAEQRVEDYKAAHNISDVNGQLVSEQQVAEINKELALARSKKAEAKARLDQYQTLQKSGFDPGAVSEAIQSPTIALLREKYAELLQRSSALASQLGAQHPARVAIDARIKDYRRRIAEELNRIKGAAKSDYERADASEKSLLNSLDQLKNATFKTKKDTVELRELERRADASRAIYTAFLSRAKELHDQQGIDTTNAHIISAAVAGEPSGPSLLIAVLGALMFGIGAGSGLAVVRDLTDGKIRTRSELTALTGAPVIASLTGVKPVRSLSKARRRSRNQGLHRLYFHLTAETGAGRPPIVIALSPVRSQLKRRLLAEIARANDAASVLLVDGDPRERKLTREMSRRASDGMVEVLTNPPGKQETPGHDHAPGVHILGITPGTEAHLAGLRTEQIVDGLGRNYADMDLILVDAAPPQDEFAIGALPAAADEILLVLENDPVDRKALKTMLSALARHQARVSGIVLVGRDRLS